MQVEATTAAPGATDADTVIVGVFDDCVPDAGEFGPEIARLIESGETAGRFASLAVTHRDGRRVIAVGLGDRAAFGPERARRAAAAAHRRAAELSAKALCWMVPAPARAEIARALVEGTLLHAYRFDRYKRSSDPPATERLILAAVEDLAPEVGAAAIVAAAQNRARDLGNTPANDLPPAALADYAQALAERHPAITVEVMDGEQIRQAGMGAFAAVAQGSAEGARLIRIEYEGPGAGSSRLGYVGKGITFDSGGISLKPPATMHEMKFDMLGAAAVIEAIAALAELRTAVRVLGIVGAAENLPSGAAVKPGDIVRALDGTTIEVNNTDAEGRLVLADCLGYARQLGCDEIVDIATLTAVGVALGSVYAGVMVNDDDWAARVEAAAARAGEPVWRLPLHADYAEMVKGRYAELTNRTERREAVTITAAELLHHFVDDIPWAHIDIASTAWDVPRPYFVGKGATGFGVRLLVELARSGSRRESA